MSKEKKISCRFYQIAGITIQLESDVPITDDTFDQRFKPFKVEGPGEDNVIIHHHYSFPDLDNWPLEKQVFLRHPWSIYKSGDSWIYLGIMPEEYDNRLWKVAVFSNDYTRSDIYSGSERNAERLFTLTSFPSDQIVVAHWLSDRNACYLHSGSVILNGNGLAFVGHSDAGKSTMMKILKDESEILCDDRNVIKRHSDGFRVHGSWSHGEIPIVSPNSAPLKAIMFIEKSKENRVIPLYDKKEITSRLLACLIKPLITADWWKKTLDLVSIMINEVPFYIVEFDKSGQIVDPLKRL